MMSRLMTGDVNGRYGEILVAAMTMGGDGGGGGIMLLVV